MIITNSDNIALYGNGWDLSKGYAHNSRMNISDRKINTENATYINIAEPPNFVGRHYTYDGDYQFTDTGLSAGKANKKAELARAFVTHSERPIVDTGLGFNAQGGYQDVVNLEKGIKQSSVKFRDDQNVTHVVTTDQLSDILELIEANGSLIMNNKWTLADAITAAGNKTELDAVDINGGWS